MKIFASLGAPTTSTRPPLNLENLRARNWGELLDAALWLYRSQLGTYLGIVFVTQIPLTALQALATALFFSMGGNSSFGAAQMVSLGIASSNMAFVVLTGLAQTFATVAVIYTTTHNYFGQPLGLIEAYQLALKQWPRWISTNIITGFALLLCLLVLIIPCAGWLVGVGLMLYATLLISPLALPIAALEPGSVAQIPQRAWHLLRRRFWWALGYTGVLSLFSLFFSVSPLLFLFVLVNGFIGDVVAYNSTALVVWQNLLQNLVQQLFTALFLPLSTICYTLLYFDLRTSTEGLDLALRVQLAQAPTAATLAALKETPQPLGADLINWKEIGYLALLGLIGGVFYFGVFFMLPFLLVLMINA